MPIDWKFNYELNEVWHSLFWLHFAIWRRKNWYFLCKNRVELFDEKYVYLKSFFSRSMKIKKKHKWNEKEGKGRKNW